MIKGPVQNCLSHLSYLYPHLPYLFIYWFIKLVLSAYCMSSSLDTEMSKT